MQLTERIWLVGSGQVGLSHQIDCHVYLVGSPGAYYLIDSGGGIEPERIVQNVQALGVSLDEILGILLTHVHADHAGGAQALSGALNAEVLASQDEARQLSDGTEATLGLDRARRSGVYPAEYRFHHHRAIALTEDWRVEVDDWVLRAVVAPGHSVGSTSYVLESGSGRDLFSGDTVFWGGKVGLLNCWGSSAEAYRESFGRLAELDIRGLYPGHFLFAVADGQRHLDDAAEALNGVYLPDSF